MRGKGTTKNGCFCPGGITPAYAGKSRTSYRPAQRGQDHPRVCGEKWGGVLKEAARKGSPPRMRGKGGPRSGRHLRGGITPAYAGKSRIHRVCTDRHRDHPRVCGEKTWVPGWIAVVVGSPPRMRGKVLAALMPTNALGITPAYAGKRCGARLAAGHRGDHPRVCGEKADAVPLSPLVRGSPPRMRGKVLA